MSENYYAALVANPRGHEWETDRAGEIVVTPLRHEDVREVHAALRCEKCNGIFCVFATAEIRECTK